LRSSIDCSARRAGWRRSARSARTAGPWPRRRGARLVGQRQRLAGRALQLLDLAHLAGELHLELALVADDGRGLLGELLVLALRLLDRLLDLDLRVGVLVELRAEAAP
jgi:hypothetical protein